MFSFAQPWVFVLLPLPLLMIYGLKPYQRAKNAIRLSTISPLISHLKAADAEPSADKKALSQ